MDTYMAEFCVLFVFSKLVYSCDIKILSMLPPEKILFPLKKQPFN